MNNKVVIKQKVTTKLCCVLVVIKFGNFIVGDSEHIEIIYSLGIGFPNLNAR